MKLLIAGSRVLNVSPQFIGCLIDGYNLSPSMIVHGGAVGVDSIAGQYAEEFKTPQKVFKPEYEKFIHKKSAPIARNIEMGKYADALLLIWDGQSKGSASMKAIMKKLNKPIYEVIIK